MNIYSTGGDEAVWTPDGSAHALGSAAHLDYESAVELLRILGLAKVRNPKKGAGEEDPWRKTSEDRVKKLLASPDIKSRFKAVQEALLELGMAPSKDKAQAIVLWSPRRLANVSLNSGNQKTGPTLCTNASQASCPDGTNNESGFRCPLYDSGCYAEDGNQGLQHTAKLNEAAGINTGKRAVGKDPSKSRYTPEDVAEDEAAVLGIVHPFWQLLRLNNGVRLHVVGDCVTPSAARTVGSAARTFAENRLTGAGVRESGAADAKNVWNYTHGWRDVPRSAWPGEISVLASCDTVEDLEEAHRKGYGAAVVVPDYIQQKIGETARYSGKAMTTENGFRLIPCPYEVAHKNNQGQRMWCIECKLCLRDEFLHRTRSAIAFAAHGTSGAKRTTAQLIQIESLTPGASA